MSPLRPAITVSNYVMRTRAGIQSPLYWNFHDGNGIQNFEFWSFDLFEICAVIPEFPRECPST